MDVLNKDKKNYYNKRKKPDWVMMWIKISTFLVWTILGVYFFYTELARPEDVTYFDRLFKISRRSFWDQGQLESAFKVALFLFVFSFISLIVNTFRMKRKDDHIRKSLVITLIFSLVSIVIYIATHFNV